METSIKVPFGHRAVFTFEPIIDNAQPLRIKLQLAYEFHLAHSKELNTSIARIYKISRTTYINHKKRDRRISIGGSGHNRLLSVSQQEVIFAFVRNLLCFGIEPVLQLVYGMISKMKQEEWNNTNGVFVPPSRSWFQKWWKSSHLHKIKSKPIASIRFESQDVEHVKEWFIKYDLTRKQYGIRKDRILNFDEAGFRVGCMNRASILVPDEVKEVSISNISKLDCLSMTHI